MTNYTETFYGCVNLQGQAIELWNSGITGTKCYFDCQKLDNYQAIPEGWK